jgi:hypothetical protein
MALPIGDASSSVGSCGEVVVLSTNATTTLSPMSRAIIIATDGTLQFLPAFQTVSVTLTVKAGAWLPLKVKEVYAAPDGSFAAW